MGWSIGFVGLDPERARSLVDALVGAGAAGEELAGQVASAAVAARLAGALDEGRAGRVGQYCGLAATALDARVERAEDHRLAPWLRSVALDALMATAAAATRPPDGGAMVTEVEIYEFTVEVAEGAVTTNQFRVLVQHLGSGEAIVSIRHLSGTGVETGVGALGWAEIGDHGGTIGLQAEAGVAAGAWTEQTWVVPERDITVLVASVLADRVPGARRVVRSLAGGVDAVVPEPLEDAIGWLAHHTGPLAAASADAFDATVDVAGYDRPAPHSTLHGVTGWGDVEVAAGNVQLDGAVGASVSVGIGAGVDHHGDRLTTAHLAGAVGAAVAGLAAGGSGAITVTRRDGDGADDDLDVDVLVMDDTPTRLTLHYDLDEVDEAQAALEIVRLVNDPDPAALEPGALARAALAADLTVTGLHIDETGASAGIDLGELAKLGFAVDFAHTTVVPDGPMAPMSPGA